jgi:hypothetical protein
MKKTALVRPTTDERARLQHLLTVGQAPTRQLTHARILLKADEGAEGPAWPDKRIAEALGVGGLAVTADAVAVATTLLWSSGGSHLVAVGAAWEQQDRLPRPHGDGIRAPTWPVPSAPPPGRDGAY